MRYALAILLAALALGGGALVLNIAILSAAPAGATQHVPATHAAPGLLWRNGSFVLQLLGEPCADAEAATVLENEGVSKPMAYATYERGQRRPGGCWAKGIGGDVMTLDAAGASGSIPIGWFTRPPGV